MESRVSGWKRSQEYRKDPRHLGDAGDLAFVVGLRGAIERFNSF
ncbi:hypothetical protein CKA32_003355 [Geitlerinema sp. FC II]|nr:hypothetical protein CKA32_003355 [Geitlerinema sp. FC II]